MDHPVNDVERDVVVTATRDKRSASQTPASISRIDDQTIADLDSKHQADVLNRNAGVYIQRGSGAESLGAIRSPVLAGPGACGAFLVAEDSLPIRPTGFCNLNEMFETNYEQAGQIEVLRGPGSVDVWRQRRARRHQSSSLRAVRSLPTFTLGLDGGSDSFKSHHLRHRVTSPKTRRAASAPMASRPARRAGATPPASMKPSSTC